MPYRHKIIQGLADLINAYGGKGKDPIMNAVWWGIKGQVPTLLQTLDDNEEAIAEIEAKLREVLGIEPKAIEQAEEIKEELVGQTNTPEKAEVKTEDKKKERKSGAKKKPTAKG